MNKSPLEKKIEDLIRPAIEDLGFALVAITMTSETKSQVVQIMAEDPKTGNIKLDDCAKVSRAVSALLDVEDPINGAYRLEVGSPGIDRPLTRIEDFKTYEGFEAKIESSQPNENGQKRFRGVLKGINGNGLITIDTDQGEYDVDFHGLIKAKLVLTDELIARSAQKQKELNA
ncbi:MAG: ribosome maturation factor RimP [Pseudomonadota bacterium]